MKHVDPRRSMAKFEKQIQEKYGSDYKDFDEPELLNTAEILKRNTKLQ